MHVYKSFIYIIESFYPPVQKWYRMVQNTITAKKSKDEPNLSKNIVFIGRKPVMAYVMAVMTAFKDHPNKVIIKARGRSISTAVDVAEVTKNNYLNNITNTVLLGTEKLETEEGGTRNVSTIEITLNKSQAA